MLVKNVQMYRVIECILSEIVNSQFATFSEIASCANYDAIYCSCFANVPA